MLTKEQADAVANAVMASGKERQRERALQRETEQRLERIRRRWAMALLALMLVGGVVAWLCGLRWSWGVIMSAVPAQLGALSYRARRNRANAGP